MHCTLYYIIFNLELEKFIKNLFNLLFIGTKQTILVHRLYGLIFLPGGPWRRRLSPVSAADTSFVLFLYLIIIQLLPLAFRTYAKDFLCVNIKSKVSTSLHYGYSLRWP